MGYFEILLLLHIFGAIIGFGPTYAFAVLGPLSGKLEGPQSLGVLKAMMAIEKKLVFPTATIVQPVTGILLIVESGRDKNFFSNEWLWIALLIYVVIYYLAVFQQNPTVEKIVAMAESGEAGTPKFLELVGKTKKIGPILTIGLTIIVFLMITKPGAPEGFF
ncbi:MAG: hypothetical protein QOG04_2223 [Actinomycetota bacterium]|jgi:uncharacterized membrane protein|nr:hypothetical protein [Actinomycetota bacterium]